VRPGCRLALASHALIALTIPLLIFSAGCTKAPPSIVQAAGVVRLDGKPLKKARVVFIPQTDVGQEYVASGLTDETGRYQLTCNGQPGACAGDNRVLILESETPPELLGESLQVQAKLVKYRQSLGNRPIPGKYGTVVRSPLRATVTSEKTEYDFVLSR
jgi:hypothetical protein